MRVLILTPYLYGAIPGPRSSIELWENVLCPEGVEFVYAPFGGPDLHELLYAPGRRVAKALEMSRAYVHRLADVRRAPDFDAVLVYREAALIGPEVFERMVARLGIPIIYQLDDPLYVPYRSPFNGYLSYLKFFGKVGRIARLSAVTIVNSSQHREYVARYTDRIRQIPSVVDGELYRYGGPPARGAGPVRVGWTGSPSTTANLRVIEPVLRAIAARPDVELRLIGAERFDLPGIPHLARRWSAATEVEDLRELDVGLLPLPEDEWTKRKFYMKLVQYMTLGIPAVCTPLGANPEVVVHGETGLLVSSEAEWLAGIESLLDPDRRASMGRAAAQRAHARYTLQAQSANIVEAFRSAVDF